MVEVKYTEEDIKSLDWKEHIRTRPGMYIGKLGDGSSSRVSECSLPCIREQVDFSYSYNFLIVFVLSKVRSNPFLHFEKER